MGTGFNCADVQTASTGENRDGANVFLIICHCRYFGEICCKIKEFSSILHLEIAKKV